MHLLEINKENYIGQADPFIFEADGKFYIYTTGSDGIYCIFCRLTFSVNGIFTAEFLLMRARAFTIFGHRA